MMPTLNILPSMNEICSPSKSIHPKIKQQKINIGAAILINCVCTLIECSIATKPSTSVRLQMLDPTELLIKPHHPNSAELH